MDISYVVSPILFHNTAESIKFIFAVLFGRISVLGRNPSVTIMMRQLPPGALDPSLVVKLAPFLDRDLLDNLVRESGDKR